MYHMYYIHAIFLVIYISLKWCTLRKKQLYQQEVLERRFGVQKSSGTSFRRIAAQFKL